MRLSSLVWRIPLLAALLALTLLLALRLGAVQLTSVQVIQAVLGEGDPTYINILHELRLPRAFQAALVGAALALSGTTYQALLRNPLAEPYVLGVSSGAAFGAVVSVVGGLSMRYIWALPTAAFAGALIAMFLVFRIAYSVGQRLDTRVLLLAGVVVGSFLVACIWLLLTFADDQSVRTAIYWMMGSHSGASWRSVSVLAATVLPGFLVLLWLARSLNLLAIGESTAAYLGAEVERVKWVAFATATLLTAVSVAMSGTIGFVGLVVPHALRLLWGGDNQGLLPTAALAGAVFLVAADTAARTVAGANELPIGVVTALVGVPCFVWLLRRPSSQRVL
ncbi:MAG TPA: iron ABC transporter permease [Gemmatimonas sp.]|uniref:FecCD family ABC transporter permease n=1 Tax=Gemmatimonas sp. TaxID=1962908 RepID=UPI002EDB2604